MHKGMGQPEVQKEKELCGTSRKTKLFLHAGVQGVFVVQTARRERVVRYSHTEKDRELGAVACRMVLIWYKCTSKEWNLV